MKHKRERASKEEEAERGSEETMAALADAIIKGGVGTIGFVASAATLTKFILSTHVVSGRVSA